MAEIQHNTDEQVREYIEKALLLVVELDPPEDLRGLVFEGARNLYSSKSIVQQAPPPLAVGGLGMPRGNSARRG